MPIFRRGETALHYEVHGTGAPLLLFAPGGPRSSIAFWERAPFHPVLELSSQFRVIAMDQRNAGASRAKIEASDGWHSFTEDHLALLDELGIERCSLLGGCIGGSFALALIAKAPERVACAVLQQPIGFDGQNRQAFYDMLDAWAAEQLRERADVSREALASFRENLYSGDFVFSVTRQQVAECPVPLLILRGNDLYHPAAISEEIAHLAPRAELIPQWKTGDDIARAVTRVRSFLAENVER